MRHKYFIPLITVLLLGYTVPEALATGPSAQCDNKGFLQAQRAFEDSSGQTRFKNDVPVHICGYVISVAKQRKTRSGEHGYFYLNVGSGVSIRIVSNLDHMQAPVWPWVNKGNYVEVVGRYYYDNPKRQGVDWTHRGASRKWPYPGYVDVNGLRFQ